MVSGDKICQFKKTRGLGLKKMEAVNNAFFLEQINLEVVPWTKFLGPTDAC